jgi:hypothetical protein
MVHVNLGAKVKEIIWSDQLNYLTVCLASGVLIIIQVDVTSQGTVLETDEPSKTQMWMSKPGELKLTPKSLS